ncbi:facilitated trehalose transporter Tret1-like [Macrosteles quadrilineatus]|uniref:facilitated trehalose transporter Tret1-like n=1 Tax=Macrosteles quadrilineatus TaxID=74068 RepID=UPI0023E0EB57|nr:facilitated trehalose transporter Tret1-like [Macrosteles quadrilineatus]
MKEQRGSFSFALVGNAAGWPSPTLIKMKNMDAPVILDSGQISWMVSMIYLGHLISPVPSGMMMDKYGRKQAILLLALLPLISWLMIFCTASATSLYIARFIAGLWAGATSTIIPIYIGEIAEPKLRGSLTMFTHLMRNFGVLLVYFVGPYVSYSELAMSCAILTFLFIVSFAFIPESPYYLLMHGKEEQAYKSLNWLRGSSGNASVNDELHKMKEAMNKQLMNKGSFKDVWNNKGNRKAFIISEVYSVTKRLTGSGVLQAYVSMTLPALTFGIFNPDDCAIILGLISLISSVTSVFLAVHFNRRCLITVSSAGCALTMALVSTWFYLRDTDYDVQRYSEWLFISYILYNSTFSLGLGPIGTSMKGELFAANSHERPEAVIHSKGNLIFQLCN